MKSLRGVYHRYQNSDQFWISYQDENGNQVRESAHTTNAELAKDFRKLRLAQVAERKLLPTRKFEQTTFGELLDFWWERHAKHRNNKFEYLLPRLDKFKPIKARNITPELVQDFLDELLKDLSPSSVNHYRTIFNSAFNFGIRWKKYDDNPIAPIRQVPENEPRDRFVSVQELALLFDQCKEQEDFELRGLAHVSLECEL